MVNQTGKRAPARKKKYKQEFYIDSANEHRWRIKSGNGKIVADSGEGYKRLADCQQSLARILSASYVTVNLGAAHG